MTHRQTNPNVDAFLARAKKWPEEFKLLRAIMLDCQLIEEFKWGNPCYTHNAKNVVLMHGFKEYCALLFFKGALLTDTDDVLIQQTQDVQAARQIRFTDPLEIVALQSVLKTYIDQAIAVEEAGLKVVLKKTAEFNMPEEFQKALDQNPDLQQAFNGLTPGRQRAYVLHFSASKQSKTRESRVEKSLQKILSGKGLDD